MWTYRLTDNKDWEAKKNGGNYISLNSSLSTDNFNAALNNLKSAKKV